MMDYCIILYRVFDVEIFSFKWRNFSKFLNQEGHIKIFQWDQQCKNYTWKINRSHDLTRISGIHMDINTSVSDDVTKSCGFKFSIIFAPKNLLVWRIIMWESKLFPNCFTYCMYSFFPFMFCFIQLAYGGSQSRNTIHIQDFLLNRKKLSTKRRLLKIRGLNMYIFKF